MSTLKHKFWVQDFDRSGRGSPVYDVPLAKWYCRPDNGRKSIGRYLRRAIGYDAIIVIYNIPSRDMGQYSKGGYPSYEAYLEYIEEVVRQIKGYDPIVIYEPDALTHEHDHPDPERIVAMKTALEMLCSVSDKVYVDIGHSAWLSAYDAAQAIDSVYNDRIRGFSLNVSNFQTTNDSLSYGGMICAASKYYNHYVIDTSRNGNGPADDNEWCNPPGRAFGEEPQLTPYLPHCDAYLWIKTPGESDGKRNGGGKAGSWYPDYI